MVFLLIPLLVLGKECANIIQMFEKLFFDL